MNEMKEYLSKFSSLLPVARSISSVEAERRSGEFLVALATIADWRHSFTEEKIKCLSVQNAVYAQELGKGTAKTMTENKVTAESSEAYTKARESLERIDNDINYLRAYQDIFKDAHIFYRQLAKQELS